MTATVNGLDVQSNVLEYDLICLEAGHTEPIIATSFRRTEAVRFETLAIPFQVYDPAARIASVVLRVDRETIATRSVDRTLQTWHYRLDRTGTHTLAIACGEVCRTCTVEVSESPVIVQPETEGLALYLAAAGRSNQDDNRARWSFGETEAVLSGFNFTTDGWLADAAGSVALRVSGDARVRIPFRIFAKDFRQTGKTIEFEFATAEVTDYEAC